MPNYANAYDVMMCEPPDNSIEEAAIEREHQERIESYVDDWIRGNLVELPGQDIYCEPVIRLTEDDWMVQLLAAKDDEELLQAARIVQAKLRQFVEEQAEEL